jgi:hypothetical protein
MVNMQFGDILQLETAFRAGVIFKFSGDADADIFLGSPIMAEALNRMLGAIQEYWFAAGNPRKAERWRDLYVVSNAKRDNYKRLVDLITSYAPRHPVWAAMTRREQLDWLHVIAAPYRLDDAGVALFERILKQ